MAWRVAVAVLASLLAWPAQPVLAQGLLQPFFGFGSRRSTATPAAALSYPASPQPLALRVAVAAPVRPAGHGASRRAAFGRPGTYRTLCVRLCDGFYFPISGATSGSGLSRDADACSASCGTEARLFYHPNGGGDVDSMVDLTGLAYSALPNAFRYRKTLVPECRCRPQPWSDAELQRHRAYAAASRWRRPGSPTPPPDPRSSTPSSDDPAA